MNTLLYLVLLILLHNITGSRHLDTTSPSSILIKNPCKSKVKCSECIQTFGCKWCKDPNFSQPRCFSDSIMNGPCKNFENPESLVVRNESTSSTINPAKVSIKLRVGKKINISMEYTDEKNRPLDLYILMDLSCTMHIHKENVAALAESLANGLSQNLTSDLKMGFGSFIDKPLGPFVSTSDSSSTSNRTCSSSSSNDAQPYLYKNHLKMTSNVTDFISTVNQASLLPNVDDPEGGLDALMQAISCTDGVGWRTADQKTRRLIVVSTDGPFHIAGDGKLGGVVLPNDGHCHLKDHFYDKATVLDYPTISQLRDQIERYNIYVIFAVAKAQLGIYGKLAGVLGPLSSVQSIDDNASSSIVKVIQSEYEKVANKVELKKVTSQDELEVTYFTKCPGSLNHEKKAGCGNLTRGAKVEFEIQVELKSCPKERDLWNKYIMIEPYQSAGTSMRLQLDMVCGCECELSDNKNNSSSNYCNNHGYLKCGICTCNTGWGGQFCNCTVKQGQSVDKEKCLDNNGKVCGNQGTCICGECQCNEGFRGSFCNCTDEDCRYLHIANEDKGFCNSEADPPQGKCICGGTCECSRSPEFNGSRCECPIDDKKCRAPYSPKIVCAGESSGQCKCGRCICNKDEGFHGTFCGLQLSNQQGTCNVDLMSNAASCVKCLTLTNVKETDETRLRNCKDDYCNGFAVTFQEAIFNFKETECKGSVEDEGLCVIFFTVGDKNMTSKTISLEVERSARPESCPRPPSPYLIVFLVVGIIFLVGIPILFIWKIVTYVHDKKEYERFEKERKNVTWAAAEENPLYKESVSEFKNPVYNVDEN